jgi:hypothetical protein
MEFLGKPFEFWTNINARVDALNAGNILVDYAMENIELRKENIRLKIELDILKEVNQRLIDESEGA